MAKWIGTQYATAAEFEAAIEAIENTVTIHPVSFMEGGKQKFLLVKAT